MGFFRRPTKVLRSIIISYLLILLLPLLTSMGVFVITTRVLLSQVVDVADASAIQLQSAVDSQLTEAALTGRSLLMQERIQALKYHTDPFEGLNLYNVSRVLQMMRTQTSASKGIREMYVVYPSNQAVLGTQGLYYGEDFAAVAARDLGIGYAAWQDIAAFNGYRGFRFVGGNGDRRLVILLTPAVTSRYTPSDLLVVVLMEPQGIQDTLSSLSADGAFQTLVTQDGVPMLRSESAQGLSQEAVAAMSGEQNTLFWPRTILRRIPSTVVQDLAYVFIVPTDGYLASFRRVLGAIGLYFMICVVAGTILALVFARRQYTPLQKLVQRMLARAGQAQEAGGDEYQALNLTLTRLLEKEKQQESLIEEHKNSIQSQMIRRILKGSVQLAQLDALQKEAYHIALEEGASLVFLCEVEDVEGVLGDDSDQDDVSVQGLMTVMLSTALRELLPREAVHYCVDLDTCVACLVHIPSTHASADKAPYASVLYKTKDFIETRLGIHISIAVSDWMDGVDHIPAAYRQAVEAYEYIKTMGSAHVTIHYDQIPFDGTWRRDAFSHMQEDERLILNAMRAGDYAAARAMVTRLFSDWMQPGLLSLREAQLRMSGLIGSMIAAFEEIRPALDDDFFASVDPVGQLYHAKSIAQLETCVSSLLDRMVEDAEVVKRTQRSYRDQELVEYVRAHYMDPMLSVASVSDALGLSAPYASRLFKQTTGVGMLDYIHLLRVAGAKELIEHTDMHVKAIAEAVGYNNALTMTRAFRKLEGITPGAYREILKDKKKRTL